MATATIKVPTPLYPYQQYTNAKAEGGRLGKQQTELEAGQTGTNQTFQHPCDGGCEGCGTAVSDPDPFEDGHGGKGASNGRTKRLDRKATVGKLVPSVTTNKNNINGYYE